MTVYALSARPGRPAPDDDAQSRPVPWRQMLWVTWRQHRALLITALAMFTVAVAAMLLIGQQIHHDYAVLTACHPADPVTCAREGQYFNSTDWHEGSGIRVAVLAAPVLLALFAGPPVLARELENGTFRYAWTQGIGRVRWTVARLAILGAAVTVAALAIGGLFTWFFAPFVAEQNLTSDIPAVFMTRDPVYAAWTLTALCLGTFLGALLRRVLPAMAATLAAFAGIGALTLFYLHGRYPVRGFWPMQFFEVGWLLVLSALLTTGTIWLVRRHAV